MCKPKTPKVQKRDLAAEQLAAERDATEKANAEVAFRKGRRRKSSLIANPGGAAGLYGGSAISQGREQLG